MKSSQPPLTLPQLKQAADRLMEAATYLRAGGFHQQGVARAYYAVYLYTRYLLVEISEAKSASRLAHARMPDFVEQVYAAIPDSSATRIRKDDAGGITDVLQQQRIIADYYGHQEISDNLSQGLMFGASAIVADLQAEADRLEGRVSP